VVGTLPVHIKCPSHNDKTRGNLAVYDDHLHCYVCGFHRNDWPEALALLLGCSEAEARAQASKYTNEALDAYRERAAQEARTDPMPFALAQIYNNMLMGPDAPRAHRQDWLLARGLTPETWERFHLGHNGCQFVIPIFDAGMNLVSLRLRRDDEYLDDTHPKYMGVKGRNGLYLYGEWLVTPEHKYLVLTEGELDAVRLWQEGIPAVSATNGAGQVRKLPALIRDRWPHIKTLIIGTDSDEAGEASAVGHTNEKGEFVPGTQQAALDLGFKVYRLKWEEGAKDVSDAIQLGLLDPRRLRAHTVALG
jgi:DNA primase